MKACRVHHFGPPDVISFEDVGQPHPSEEEVLVRVKAAGVGPWDAWIRAGKSVLPQPLPLILGSDLSGTVEAIGPAVTALKPGVEVFGVTNRQFTGAYAQYAVASVGMIAARPVRLSDVETASVPVVAVTAQQALLSRRSSSQVRRCSFMVPLGMSAPMPCRWPGRLACGSLARPTPATLKRCTA
jgi:NADPH:quinone reductase-like Zn-dependent oxidoreductase